MRLRFDILLKQRSIHELSEGNPVRKTRMQGVSLSDVLHKQRDLCLLRES